MHLLRHSFYLRTVKFIKTPFSACLQYELGCLNISHFEILSSVCRPLWLVGLRWFFIGGIAWVWKRRRYTSSNTWLGTRGSDRGWASSPAHSVSTGPHRLPVRTKEQSMSSDSFAPVLCYSDTSISFERVGLYVRVHWCKEQQIN